MFVFRRKDLPPDPVFPVDLKKLGYFINNKEQIKKISDPEQDFQFKINKNHRWNEMQREAMNSCIRSEVFSRLLNLGLFPLRLPLNSGPNKPHVPILVSKNLRAAQRVIVVFGEPVQDLGIFAYRTVGSEGIPEGSAICFVRDILKKNDTDHRIIDLSDPEPESVAIVLANTGQLIWYCGSGRAMSLQSWEALPRPTAVDPPLVMAKRNKIPGNGDWQEHVNCVFNEILAARGRLISKEAKIDIIGLAEGGLAVVRYLSKNWSIWGPYVSAMCLGNPLHSIKVDVVDEESSPESSFKAFLSSRCRAYLLSHHILGMPLPDASDARDFGCNCYSSGEALNVECIMPQAWRSMVEWLDLAYANPDYCEAQLEVRDVEDI